MEPGWSFYVGLSACLDLDVFRDLGPILPLTLEYYLLLLSIIVQDLIAREIKPSIARISFNNSYEYFVYFQVLNIIILVLYRTGFNGEFLGVGGTWNLNEEKNPDAEIVASGVIVGYLIYTLVQIVTYLFGTTEHKR